MFTFQAFRFLDIYVLFTTFLQLSTHLQAILRVCLDSWSYTHLSILEWSVFKWNTPD